MTVEAGRVRGVVAVLSVVVAAAVDPGNAQAAGAAYQVDTAEVSSVGSCKVESWVSLAGNHDFFAAVSPACVVDLSRPVELSAQFSRARFDGEWVTAVTPKVKTNIVPGGIGSWSVALAAVAAYDFTAREVASFAVTVPATLRLSNVVRINVNAGWLFDRTADRHYLTYGAGFDWRTPNNVWTLTGEVFGLVGAAEERGVVEPRFQLGIRYRPVDRFNIDLIYGRNLIGENANWITLTTIVRFPAPEK
jgi:hypothetical protein